MVTAVWNSNLGQWGRRLYIVPKSPWSETDYRRPSTPQLLLSPYRKYFFWPALLQALAMILFKRFSIVATSLVPLQETQTLSSNTLPQKTTIPAKRGTREKKMTSCDMGRSYGYVKSALNICRGMLWLCALLFREYDVWIYEILVLLYFKDGNHDSFHLEDEASSHENMVKIPTKRNGVV